MRNRMIVLLLACLLALPLTACGGGGGDGSSASGETQAAGADRNGAAYDMDMPEEEAGIPSTATNADLTAYSDVIDQSKLILRGSVSAEATDFDAAVQAVSEQAAKAGGYLESSSVSGEVGYRWAEFTIRVPREQFETVFSAIAENCHVTSSSRSSENVSADYYDTENRKAALETKRDRLLALLDKADTMEDIIALESALSEVQYQIESLSGTLRNYDRLITFSTIEVHLSEVRDLSIVEEPSFIGDLRNAAISGTRGLVSFVQGVVLAVVYGWWFFLLLAVVVFLSVRRVRKTRKERDEAAARLREIVQPSKKE